jgi:hypothetical protein
MQISDVFQVVLKQNEIVSIDKAGYYNENWGKNGRGEKMVTRKKLSQGKKKNPRKK